MSRMREIFIERFERLERQAAKIPNYKKQIRNYQGALNKWKARALEAELKLERIQSFESKLAKLPGASRQATPEPPKEKTG